jgi:hypothetical protein
MGASAALEDCLLQLLDGAAVTAYFCLFDWNGYYASLIGLVVQATVLGYKYDLSMKLLAEDPPRKLSFPKDFDTTQLIMFVALAAVTLPELYTQMVSLWNNFIWTASFGVVGMIGYIYDRPFLEQYVQDEMPEEVGDTLINIRLHYLPDFPRDLVVE